MTVEPPHVVFRLGRSCIALPVDVVAYMSGLEATSAMDLGAVLQLEEGPARRGGRMVLRTEVGPVAVAIDSVEEMATSIELIALPPLTMLDDQGVVRGLARLRNGALAVVLDGPGLAARVAQHALESAS